MQVTYLEIPEVMVFSPEVFRDCRGFFTEIWNHREFAKAGCSQSFVQENLTLSRSGSLRGVHYQLHNPQGKLIRVTRGEIFDVAVDLRNWSPTFGKWASFNLRADSMQVLWIPPGFGHGFLALADNTETQYKCSDYYNPESERCIIWNDKTLGIAWPIPPGFYPILSDKDKNGIRFKDAEVFTSPSQLNL